MSPVRMAISAVLLAAAFSTAIFVWVRFLSPQVFAPVVQSTATATPSGDPSSNPPIVPSESEPKWAPLIADGQKLFTAGNYADAKKKFDEVASQGGLAARIAAVYMDQTKVAEKATGSCKPASFSRPRTSFERRAERPAIAATSKGTLLAWIDDHEQEKRDHVYATMLDQTGKAVGPLKDLTPEATEANRPQFAALGADRLVLLYWDEKGKEAGVRARLLDADGRIDKNKGNSVLVGAARAGQFWPTIDKGPQAFHVVWQDDRDKENDFDLFTRRLSFDLDTIGPETRLTDYTAPAKSKSGPPRVRYPAVAVVANTLVIAYRLEREKEKLVVRMRVPLGDLERGGLDESKEPNRTSRELGDVSLVSEDKSPADAPAVACGPEGCFIVWHGDTGGAWAAMIDPKEGRVIWRKKFADKGGRPSLGVNEGQVAVAYYEKNLIKLALLTGDGVGPASTLFRIFDEKNVPRPTIAAGTQKNEWQLAWQDSDVPRGLGEVYAARVVCR
jgi:serine/threonine-protein kinase